MAVNCIRQVPSPIGRLAAACRWSWPALAVVGFGLALPAIGVAQPLPCRPCAGVRLEDPATVLPQLTSEPALTDDAILFVAWDLPLDGSANASSAKRVEEAGGVPWLRLQFTTPAPLKANLDRLELELEQASVLAGTAGPGAHFQILWIPDGEQTEELAVLDYAFLLKRAAVAVTGAQVSAQVISQPLRPDLDQLRALYSEDVAAYLEAIAIEPAGERQNRSAIDLLMELDPGTPIIADALPYPGSDWQTLALAARQSVLGFSVSIFDATTQAQLDLGPLKLLAREFQGDIAYDPYSSPSASNGAEAWSFVRGEDLSLRVIVQTPAPGDDTELIFSDGHLRNPERIDPETGEPLSMYGGIRDSEGYTLNWQPPETVTVLRLDRPGAEEIEGISGLEEEVTVFTDRQLPVEEILRRLQAVEDAQSRRIHTYQGINSTHLRFQFGTEGLEVTFEGEIFFRQGQGYDWAWQKFNLNGLRWKGREFPKVPLIQPERAATLPLDILFRADYRYNLRGTAEVESRDCWVVDFRPLALEEEESLYRGTVWIDRELNVRVRSRAVQLGLKGEVLSNEETITYSPLDSQGRPGEWTAGNSWLPLRMVSQQIWSVFNGSLIVEKETNLTDVSLNNPGFEARRQELLDSKFTMVRETEEGTRYLVHDKKTGERVVQEKLTSNRLFLAGGVFYDPSLEYPLPLAGVDYFSLDFLNKGSQVNVFFGGALINGSYADPSFLGSRFDAGIDLLAIAVRGSDTLYRDDLEVPAEEIQQRPFNIAFNLGHPVGKFAKLTMTYRLRHTDYSETENTSADFVLPVDHFTHTVRLGGTYSRFGYRFRINGTYNKRSDWQPWGLPDSGEFDPDQAEYLRWKVVLAKTLYFQHFRRAGIDLQYVDGQNLDRFSKYELGFFSDVRVRGYESNRIRAERAFSATISYGIEVGELFRLQGLADLAWITDEISGLQNEFASGVGVAGTIIGPWQTIVRLDLGKAVAGPDDGFSIFMTFLKLW